MVLTKHGAVEVEYLDPLNGDQWDREVLGHPKVSVFHESSWIRVLADCYGHSPLCLRLCHGQETLALVPLVEVKSLLKGKRGVSVPFADFGGALTSAQGAGQELVGVLESLAGERSWRHLELREEINRGTSGDGVEPSYVGHRLALDPEEQGQFGRLSSAAQRSVRKARAAGLSHVITCSWDGVRKFYDLHAMTRRRLGSPPQPLEFFRLLHSHLISAGKGFVSLVGAADQPVAGAIFLHCASNAVFKFGASDSSALADRPNHLAIWEGIQELRRRGVGELQFGRTTPAQEGLRRFKKSWGATEFPIFYNRYCPESGSWTVKPPESGAPGWPPFQFMPLPINRIAGRLLYRQFD